MEASVKLGAVKSISRHVEDLADGRTIAPGETAFDVDVNDEHNKGLIERNVILALDKKQANANAAYAQDTDEMVKLRAQEQGGEAGGGENANEGEGGQA